GNDTQPSLDSDRRLLQAAPADVVGGRPDVDRGIAARNVALLLELPDLVGAVRDRALALDRVAVMERLLRAFLEEAGRGHAACVAAKAVPILWQWRHSYLIVRLHGRQAEG